VVHYLIDRYGGETFLRLYSGVRRDSFHDNCRAILGDSWETVEEDFWKWLEAEGELLAEADGEQPQVHVELAQSVDPADWQALVEGYREANKDPLPLPSNTAFVLEGEVVDGEPKSLRSTSPPEFEFRAIFEDQQLWIFDNYYGYSGTDWFLMVTPEHCGELTRNDSGGSHGWAGPDWNPYAAREGASELLAFYRRQANPANLLPFREIPREATYQIERVVRPTGGTIGRWDVWITEHWADRDAKVDYQVELDPAKRWWITRIVEEDLGGVRSETDAEYEHIGDALMPVTLQFRIESDEGTATMRWRVRTMSEVERQELKRRVEQAVRSGMPVPYQGLGQFLLALVLACPLVGAALLAITRRCEPTEGTPRATVDF
jgi:hypothetical protein